MSDSEKRFARWLTATGAAYAVGAADFLVRPHASTRSLSLAGGDPLADESPGLYHSLACAYMATIAALSLTAAREPGDRRELIPPLVVAKAVSSATLMYRFRQTGKRGFLVGSILDAVLLGVTAGFYSSLD
ncbi:MAG: hypothetical protein M3290_13485 [Actinomycetota bacterium]|nr:hypothetical protein [Actinomycetota bacterium]